MSNEEEKYFLDAGFFNLVEVQHKGICGLQRFMFTIGLCYGLQQCDFNIYEGRYCFDKLSDAKLALSEWDGKGDAPGEWIKHKGKNEYSNPKLQTT